MADGVSKLIQFYRGEGRDAAGRTIEEIWAWDHRHLEMVHDYIQWLFPLPERSRFNPFAPLLTDADKATFRAEHDLRGRVIRSLNLMLEFLGLERRAAEIVRAATF